MKLSGQRFWLIVFLAGAVTVAWWLVARPTQTTLVPLGESENEEQGARKATARGRSSSGSGVPSTSPSSGGEVTNPVKLSGPSPAYTEQARLAKIQGTVILEAIIDETGRVEDLRVLKPLPMGLDQAAMEAVRQWRFSPAKVDGRAVEVRYNLRVDFRLE